MRRATDGRDRDTDRAGLPGDDRHIMTAEVLTVHFSSNTDLWSTPQTLFNTLQAEFGFTLDVCANADNAKCLNFFAEEQDGLAQEWTGTCWCNPPYGREIGKWVKKAYYSAEQGATVVCLLPARTDTAWWHTYVSRATEIRLYKGRLKFGAATNSAPFPSALILFCAGELNTGRVVHAVQTAQNKQGINTL